MTKANTSLVNNRVKNCGSCWDNTYKNKKSNNNQKNTDVQSTNRAGKIQKIYYYFYSTVFAVGLGILTHTFTDIFIKNNFSW